MAPARCKTKKWTKWKVIWTKLNDWLRNNGMLCQVIPQIQSLTLKRKIQVMPTNIQRESLIWDWPEKLSDFSLSFKLGNLIFSSYVTNLSSEIVWIQRFIWQTRLHVPLLNECWIKRHRQSEKRLCARAQRLHQGRRSFTLRIVMLAVFLYINEVPVTVLLWEGRCLFYC